jgi:glutathione S-transferase
MTTLYHSPGTCSLGIHLLLEEIGKPYQLELVDLTKGMQHKPEFVAVNPKSKVPALKRDDGSLLTEWPAIAVWLALTNPEKKLLPSDAEGMARTLETVDYVVASVHMQGFTRMWMPQHFSSNEADHPAIKEKGRGVYDKGLAHFNALLGSNDYFGGAQPNIADYAVFYVEYWKVNRLKEELPPNLAAHYQRMRARPAVEKAIKMEGLP